LTTSFTILVGTMTGTAELVAEEIKDALEPKGHEIDVKVMDGLDAAVFEPGRTYLICTSTYGQGDVPDNGMKLYDDLASRRPDLTGVRYGVLSLGDRTYAQTFCHGGKRFDEILTALKAERIGDILMHDASAGTVPEEVSLAWTETWLEAVASSLSEAA
jgi:MioC protein